MFDGHSKKRAKIVGSQVRHREKFKGSITVNVKHEKKLGFRVKTGILTKKAKVIEVILFDCGKLQLLPKRLSIKGT